MIGPAPFKPAGARARRRRDAPIPGRLTRWGSNVLGHWIPGVVATNAAKFAFTFSNCSGSYRCTTKKKAPATETRLLTAPHRPGRISCPCCPRSVKTFEPEWYGAASAAARAGACRCRPRARRLVDPNPRTCGQKGGRVASPRCPRCRRRLLIDAFQSCSSARWPTDRVPFGAASP